MGDTDVATTENLSESTENVASDVSKSSVNELNRSKPNENIAISEANKELDGSSITNIYTELKTPTVDDTIDTLQSAGETRSEHVDDNEEKVKNKSHIFSFDDTKDLPSTIFSVGGAPSKTIHKPSIKNRICPNDGVEGTKPGQFRNPLTGIGVSSNDEFKNKPSKRRDGNPLLGVGYKDDDYLNAHTNQRIPPGGYSKGLW